MSNITVTPIALLFAISMTLTTSATFAELVEQPDASTVWSPWTENADSVNGVDGVGLGAAVEDGLQSGDLLGPEDPRLGCLGMGRRPVPFCSTGLDHGPKVDTDAYVGLLLSEAKALAAADGVTFRILRNDDQTFVGTMDYRTDRLNFHVDDGIVTSCTKG